MPKKPTRKTVFERLMSRAAETLRHQATSTNEFLAGDSVQIQKAFRLHHTNPATGSRGITGLIVERMLALGATSPDAAVTRETVAEYVFAVMHREGYTGDATRYVASVGVYLSDRLNEPDATHPRRKAIVRGGCVSGGEAGRKVARYFIPADKIEAAKRAAGIKS